MQTDDEKVTFKNIFNLRFVSAYFSDFLHLITNLISVRKNIILFPVSVDVLIKARRNAKFFAILNKADFLLPDGMPIVWAGKILGEYLKARIPGSDLLPALCAVAANKNFRVFFLGGRPGVAGRATKALKRKYPELNIAGVYSPPFGFEKNKEENEKIIKMIIEEKPDILFVGLGVFKQEEWIWKHRDKINIPLSIAVGASFDFIAGNLKRAPKWIQKIGFEWLWRLIQEPHRLWKRYLIGNGIFMYLVMEEIWRRIKRYVFRSN